jgi:hypothetical protein
MKTQTKRTRLFLPALIALTFASAGALAQEDKTMTNQPQQAASPEQPKSTSQSPMDATTAAPATNSTLAQAKFDMLDTNHDGYVDKQEANASSALSARFSKIDGNRDGKLSLTEFASINDLASIKIDKKKGYE